MNIETIIKRAKRKGFLITAGVALFAVAVFLLLRDTSTRNEYRTESVRRGNLTAAVTATGIVNPVTTVLVGTQVSGIVKEIFADYNSQVRKGQLIALIDPASFEAQVEQARANLGAAKADLAKARAALADAERTLRRNRELYDKHLIAESEVDTAETNYETAKAQVAAAEAGVAQAGAALRIAETNLRYTRIVSPVDGVVISRNVDRGQTVAATFQTPTLFVIAQDLTKMQINTSVGEADIGTVKVGQAVEFTVDAYPDRTFAGTVQQVRIEPVTVQNVVTYDAVIVVDNRELLLKPGMTANVSILTARRSNVLLVPNTALRFRMTKASGPAPEARGPAVWVLDRGTPKRVPVTLGVSDGTYTEVVSGDLTESDTVIVSRVSNEKRSQAPRGPRLF